MKPINPKSVRNRLERDFTPFSSNMVGEKLSQDQNIHKKQTLKQLWRLKIKSLYESTCKGLSNKRVRLLYQDEAGFGRISKPSACWAPRGMRPTVPYHHGSWISLLLRSCWCPYRRYFFIIAGACNTAWMNEFLQQLSAYYSNDYLILVMDNASFHPKNTLDEN